MYLPKTENELKTEWGIERFVTAMGILSRWWLVDNKQHPISLEQLCDLDGQSPDALTLFASRQYYEVSKRLD